MSLPCPGSGRAFKGVTAVNNTHLPHPLEQYWKENSGKCIAAPHFQKCDQHTQDDSASSRRRQAPGHFWPRCCRSASVVEDPAYAGASVELHRKCCLELIEKLGIFLPFWPTNTCVWVWLAGAGEQMSQLLSISFGKVSLPGACYVSVLLDAALLAGWAGQNTQTSIPKQSFLHFSLAI